MGQVMRIRPDVRALASFLSALALTGFGAPDIVWTLPKMRSAPVLDGRLGEDEWRDAVENCRFFDLGSTVAFSADARVWIGRDDAAFYLAAKFDKGPYPIKRDARSSRGGGAYNDDSLEFDFIPDAGEARPLVYHCAVNANGVISGTGSRGNVPVVWNPSCKVACEELADHWTIELMIPLSDLGFTAENASRHAIRIIRNWKRVGKEWGFQSTLEPGCKAFRAVKTAPRLVFDDAAPSVQAEIEPPTGSQGYPVVLRLGNPTSVPLALNASVVGKARESQPTTLVRSVTLAAGEQVKLQMGGIASPEELVNLEVAVSTADGSRTYYVRTIDFQCAGPAPQWIKPGATGGGAVFKTAYYPSYDKMVVSLDASSVKPRPSAFDATLTLLDGRNAALATVTRRIGADGKLENFIWTVPDLRERTRKSGSADYRVVLSAPDVRGCAATNDFVRQVFEWEGNGLGKSAAIPEPFVPIEADVTARTVRTVCKCHVLDELGLWKDVRVTMTKDEYGAESAPTGPFGAMAAPMRLEAMKDGRTTRIAGRGLAFVETAPTCVRTVAEFDGPVAGRSSAAWEIDGQMTWTLDLERGAVDALRLVIPMDGRETALLHACTDGLRINYADEIPAGHGRVWDGSRLGSNGLIGDYRPYVWVGGPVAGLAVYGDNDRGWQTGGAPCQEIVREDDGTVSLVLNLVSKPLTVDVPRTIRIGFLATPVKPMEEGWRGRPVGRLVGSCFAWGAHVTATDFQTFDPTDSFWKAMAETRRTGKRDRGFIESYLGKVPPAAEAGSEKQRKYVERLRREFNAGMWHAECAHRDGEALVFYTNGRGIATGVEPGYTFQDEWTLAPFRVRKRSAFGGLAYSMDPAPSLLDYQVWCFRRMLDSGACDRIYWDDIFLSPNYSLVGTDAYVTSEGIQPACGIFRMREQVRRTAVMQKELGYDPRHNWIHMTSTALAPVSAFAGIHYDLEDAHAPTSMQERYSRAFLLAGTAGRQFGVQTALLSFYDASDKRLARTIERSNTGVDLTFELYWQRGPKSYHALLGKIRDWGYGKDGTKVWNWWDGTRYPVAVRGSETSSVAMARNGRALIVVSNWGDGADVEIGPDASRLGLPKGFAAKDFETGARLPTEDGVITVHIDKGDFAIVACE